MRILFTGGGSGGHFFPIIAVVRELKRIAEEDQILDLEFFYMGPDWFGADILETEDVIPIKVGTGKWRRYVTILNVFDMIRAAFGILHAVVRMFFIMPDVVFSKGGYGALPAAVASALFGIPLIIHESDSVPGKVNLWASRFAVRIGIAFTSAQEYFPKEKTAVIGVPIRKRILGGKRETAREYFDVFSDLPVIGVLGASQGAVKINDTLMSILKELTDRYEVIHQTGEKNVEEVKGEAGVVLEFGQKERYHPRGFLDEEGIREFYAACDLIVSRAGASSIFEIAAWGKPAILVPLSNAAQDHQLKNAYEYVAVGAAEMIEEANFTPHILLSEINRLMSHEEILKKMNESSQRFARIDAAEIIAREILKLGLH